MDFSQRISKANFLLASITSSELNRSSLLIKNSNTLSELVIQITELSGNIEQTK